MNIQDLIDKFIQHIKQYGLGGDPNQQEIYKWELVSQYHDKLDADSNDFAKNIMEMNFLNLWYASNQRKAMQNFAKCEPEEYRTLHQLLYDESQPLQERITTFTEGCDELWDSKIKQLFPRQKTGSCCDERLISCFLATKFPEKYTFYKNDVYLNLCEILGVESKKAGQKLVHFYDLLNEHVIPLVKSNSELCGLVDAEIEEKNLIHSMPLTAQTVIWHAMSTGMFHKKKVWIFLASEDENLFDDMVKGNYLSIYEWGEIGSLADLRNKDAIKAELKDKVEEYHDKEPMHSVKMLYNMKCNMNVGDYVLCRNKDFKLIAQGEVTGGYFYNTEHSVNNHCVEVKWNPGEWDISTMLSSKDKNAASLRLEDVTKTDWAQRIMSLLDSLPQVEENNSIPTEEIKMKEVATLIQKKQIVLQGAPGTGKTYKTAAIAVAVCDGESKLPSDRKELMRRYRQLVEEKRVAFTTFHQSMDYEEFVEGIKPLTEEGGVSYEVCNGIFREICSEAQKSQRIESNDNFEEVWSKLITYLDENDYIDVTLLNGTKTFRVELNEMGTGLANRTYPNDDYSKGNWIDGKSKFFNKDQMYNIYRGLPGTPAGGHDNYRKAIVKHLKKEFGLVEYKEGTSNNGSVKNYVLIIDEINRANLSKVLGELITLLEADKRLGEMNEVKVKLPYSKDEFGVPANLYIIGTMNTADRSVGYIDYAIRRRFAFITIKADRSVIESFNTSTSTLALQYFDKVKAWMSNDNVIGDIDADDLMVGHSYFLADSIDSLKTKMLYEVIPLLLEYINDGILNADIKQEIKDWEEELG